MKKLIAMLLAAMLLLCLAACGAEETGDMEMMITRSVEEETAAVEEAVGETVENTAKSGPYVFVTEGVELVPGMEFDAAALPAAASVYQVPSCAIEGTDNVYNYNTFEVTAYDDGNGEVIYSIYFVDPNLTTPEGLALGDDMAKVVELYGDGYAQDGTACVYSGGETMLIIIVENDVVKSIEYRMEIK